MTEEWKIMPFSVEGTISEDGRWIELTFPYDRYLLDCVRNIVPQGRFIPPDKGGPKWRFPKDLDVGKQLRKELGDQFVPDRDLKQWAMRERSVALTLRSLSAGTSAKLERLPKMLEELNQAIHLGPLGRDMDPKTRKQKMEEDGSFQTADVAFMAKCPFPINANHPGTGKTLETIASVFEAGQEDGPKLVVAPLTSLETVWEQELTDWQYQDIILCFGSKNRRDDAIAAAMEYVKEGEPFWFITNPDTLRFQQHKELDPVTGEPTGKRKLFAKYPQLLQIEWDIVVLDEFQKMGLANDTLTSHGLFALKKRKGIGLSGTPIKGKPINLWGILRFLDPENFQSKWRFAEQWLVIRQGRYGKEIGDVRAEREEEFWELIGKYMIRRTKEEVLPWLPPKQRINVWAEMDGKQLAQYKTFAEQAEIRIEEEKLTATSILAEYTRLKQFSFSAQRLEPLEDPPFFAPYPTEESCKLPHLEEILRELGIIHDKKSKEDLSEEQWSGEQVIIFSQFTRVVDFVERWLQEKHGIRTAKITGAVTGTKRSEEQRAFQSKDENRPQVILMNTTAGGVSITLDNANTVIFLDETWVPDEQEQAEDRAHRASRIHQVTIYYIRTKGTIEEYIYKRVASKQNVNQRILDLRREGLRATEG